MSKNQIIIALVVLCLVGTIWGSVQNKKSTSLERQLVAMRKAPEAPVITDVETKDAQVAANTALEEITNNAVAEIEELKAQNAKLLENAATLKGSVTSQQDEIASLKKELAESGGSQALEVMQAQLDKRASDIAALEEAVGIAKTELDKKNAALAVAEEAVAGFEEVKSTLANSVDAYSAKSQALSVEIEEYTARIQAIEKALEERTKLLVGAGEDLARTKLNMNILLSKIAAQNNSLEILEETRVALEKELAMKLQVIEELQHQLSAQVVIEAVILEEAPVVEEAPAAAVEEAPAN